MNTIIDDIQKTTDLLSPNELEELMVDFKAEEKTIIATDQLLDNLYKNFKILTDKAKTAIEANEE
eukprot:CAMPEP_0114983298 /NCGR_PEP_ID=MMETSP0216-20121206/6614_1 /TAXON_ID=223996 /ORGANISM="Protocruzia adherens, Strain Boccale" /LENGTH=64 /DNA_ID=CAMNT_0002345249 /DNA_START=145 /DNA_END=339 /DNA_ORIENTATION=-